MLVLERSSRNGDFPTPLTGERASPAAHELRVVVILRTRLLVSVFLPTVGRLTEALPKGNQQALKKGQHGGQRAQAPSPFVFPLCRWTGDGPLVQFASGLKCDSSVLGFKGLRATCLSFS